MVIFLDLDGVIIDWAKGVCNWFGIPYEPEKITHWYIMPELVNLEPNNFWDSLNSRKFWEHLELYPDARSFIEELNQYGQVILFTSPAHNCAGYRQKWIEHYLPELFYENLYILGAPKWACAHSGTILIDDHDVNCKEFIHHGGKAILYPQPWNDAGKSISGKALTEKEKNNLVIETLISYL
jgi:5'(3')-deoxyribonucleotidase